MVRMTSISQRMRRRRIPRRAAGDESVILAHSDPEVRNILAYFLTDLKYKVIEVDSRVDAVRRIRKDGVYPLLMIEADLEGTNQLVQIRRLREHGALSRRMPVVFITHDTDSRASQRVRKVLPHTGILRPPYTDESVSTAIRRAKRASSGSSRRATTAV